MRIILDANQFVSAVLVPVGHPAQILQAWRTDQFDLVVSPAIVAEIRRVLLYAHLQEKHGWNKGQVNEFLAGIVDAAIIVPGEVDVRAVPDDPTDDKYVACALEGNAEYIVSGDEHLKRLGSYRGIEVVAPSEFLDLLAKIPG